MNLNIFRKNIGRTFKFRPLPRRDNTEGSWQSDLNLWILQGETEDKKGFTFQNAYSDQHSLVIQTVHLRNFDEPDILNIRGQVVLKKNTVSFEPFVPTPSLASNASLSLLLNGEETGLVEICPPISNPIEVTVENHGGQTVQGFRVTIYVPAAFRDTSHKILPNDDGVVKASSQPLPGALTGDHELTIEGDEYIAYTKFVSEPIFNDDRVCIGTLCLSAGLGEYVFQWRIRCDDGVFPTATDRGRIKVKVVGLAEFVGNALDSYDEASDEP